LPKKRRERRMEGEKIFFQGYLKENNMVTTKVLSFPPYLSPSF